VYVGQQLDVFLDTDPTGAEAEPAAFVIRPAAAR
jgi:hypothetical protein